MIWDSPVIMSNGVGRLPTICEAGEPDMVGRPVVATRVVPRCGVEHPSDPWGASCIRESGHTGAHWQASPEIIAEVGTIVVGAR